MAAQGSQEALEGQEGATGPLPLLDGRYGLPGGLGDALGAIAQALAEAKGLVHVVIMEEF